MSRAIRLAELVAVYGDNEEVIESTGETLAETACQFLRDAGHEVSERPVKLVVTIEHDPDCSDPCQDDLWMVYSADSRLTSYKDFASFTPTERRDLRLKVEEGRAFWLDRSGDDFRISNRQKPPWGTMAGILVYEGDESDLPDPAPASSDPSRRDVAEGFLETYNLWANGDTYGYAVDRNGETIHSSCGLIGTDHLVASINDFLKAYPTDQLTVEGEPDGEWVNDIHN
jgi:hypothetical protein